jgi:hypothetical protein
MKHLTNLENRVIVKLERSMIRSIFALYPGPSRKGIRAIVGGITIDSRHVWEIEFVEKKTSRRRKNKGSVIRAATREHRAVSGLVDPAEKVSGSKEDEERWDHLMLRYFVFFGPRTRTQGRK